MQVRELIVNPLDANEVRLMCPHCSSAVYVPVPWNCSYQQRQAKIRESIEEHRRICAKAPPEAGRVFKIDYPRA